MKRLNLVLVLLLLMSIALVRSAIGDDRTCTTNPKDGSNLPECNTPADNECYPAGAMDGKCQTLRDWNAGWYLARLNRGILSRDNLPAEFRDLAPTSGGGGQSGSGDCTVTYNQSSGEVSGKGSWASPITGQTQANLNIVFSTITYDLSVGVSASQTSASFNGNVIVGLTLDRASLRVITPGNRTTVALCSVVTVG